ncbi:DUF1801 domain-containing protein [Candidatus Gracilibacteria bacterium]|nr:DUF1801 domain-containing protein [Candidatus Gracilibacteria bacterium]NJS41841.1 DUF1801 domain-containing protein [Candidatus Gracilibacteria bacterium]
MAKTNYQTIDEYHKTFPQEKQERMEVIRQTIKKAAPETEEIIHYQIPAFRIGKDIIIYYSAYTNHITLANVWSKELLKEFSEELSQFKVTKSAILLPNIKPLPVDFIKKLILFRKKEVTK